MSKKFSGKQCVYCNQRESTNQGDHVFPRGLFLERRRDNLPKIPCCKECNCYKSKLETNLLAILPVGANHEDAKENLTSSVPGRLEKNQKLQRKLQASFSQIVTQNNFGISESRLAITFDSQMCEQLLELFNLITIALTYFHFDLRLPSNYSAESFNNRKANVLASIFNDPSRNPIEKEFGNGTIWYRGTQVTENKLLTFWEYKIYGGLQFFEGAESIFSRTFSKYTQKNVELYNKFCF